MKEQCVRLSTNLSLADMGHCSWAWVRAAKQSNQVIHKCIFWKYDQKSLPRRAGAVWSCKGWPNIILNPMDPGWDVTQGICVWRQNPFCLTKCVMFFGVCFFKKILFHVVNPWNTYFNDNYLKYCLSGTVAWIVLIPSYCICKVLLHLWAH